MPGRAPRTGEARLSSKQSRAASKFLLGSWCASVSWDGDRKQEITSEINALFEAMGEPPEYSRRKLEDWLSNARYRSNCQAGKLPRSWTVESRAAARSKARAAKQKQKRSELTQTHRTGAGNHATTTPAVKQEPTGRVQEILRTFESAAPNTAAQPTVNRPRMRSYEFRMVRDKFEAEQYGRSDPWVSHRSGSSSASRSMVLGEPAQFVDCTAQRQCLPLEGAPATDNGNKVATFLTVPNLSMPETVDPDPAEFDLLEGIPLIQAIAAGLPPLTCTKPEAVMALPPSVTLELGPEMVHMSADEQDGGDMLVSPTSTVTGHISLTPPRLDSGSVVMPDADSVDGNANQPWLMPLMPSPASRDSAVGVSNLPDHSTMASTASNSKASTAENRLNAATEPNPSQSLLHRPASWSMSLDMMEVFPTAPTHRHPAPAAALITGTGCSNLTDHERQLQMQMQLLHNQQEQLRLQQQQLVARHYAHQQCKAAAAVAVAVEAEVEVEAEADEMCFERVASFLSKAVEQLPADCLPAFEVLTDH